MKRARIAFALVVATSVACGGEAETPAASSLEVDPRTTPSAPTNVDIDEQQFPLAHTLADTDLGYVPVWRDFEMDAQTQVHAHNFRAELHKVRAVIQQREEHWQAWASQIAAGGKRGLKHGENAAPSSEGP